MNSLHKRPHWVPVVAGVLLREGKILIGQRPTGQNLPGLWEFPGGKIELGESPEEALQRELQEELNIEADVGHLILTTTHQYGTTGIVLLFFYVGFWKGEIQAMYHRQLNWVLPQEIRQWPFPEANQKGLDRILLAIKSSSGLSIKA